MLSDGIRDRWLCRFKGLSLRPNRQFGERMHSGAVDRKFAHAVGDLLRDVFWADFFLVWFAGFAVRFELQHGTVDRTVEFGRIKIGGLDEEVAVHR